MVGRIGFWLLLIGSTLLACSLVIAGEIMFLAHRYGWGHRDILWWYGYGLPCGIAGFGLGRFGAALWDGGWPWSKRNA